MEFGCTRPFRSWLKHRYIARPAIDWSRRLERKKKERLEINGQALTTLTVPRSAYWIGRGEFQMCRELSRVSAIALVQSA